jgi:hypothetical protein
VGAAIAFLRQRGQRVPQAAWTVAATAVAFTTAVFSWAAVRVDRHQQNQVLLAAINRAVGSPRVGAYGRLEPTWIFYGGRPIDELTLDASGTESSQTGTWKPRPRLPAAEFFSQGRDCLIITTDRRWTQLRAVLPQDATIVAECPLFLRRERLLLVGALSPDARTARGCPKTPVPLQ